MLERALDMLVSEVSIARNVSQLDAVTVLNRALGKSHLAFPEAA